MIKKIKPTTFLSLAILLFLLTITFPVFKRTVWSCYNTWDLGIFTQALRLINIEFLNPQLSIYPFKIFNDHFDIILIPIAFISKIFPTNPYLILVESIFLFLGLWIWRLISKEKDEILIWGAIYYLFGRATIYALTFPVHPTSWAVFPLMMVGYSLIKNKETFLYFSLLFLFTFKEEFPFVGLALSVPLFLNGKKRESFITFFISLVWLIFAVVVRPRIFDGEFNNHGGALISILLSTPIEQILKNFTLYRMRIIFEIFAPLVLVLFINRKRLPSFKALIKNEFIWMILPLLGIRFLSGSWGFQYSLPLVPLLILISYRSNLSLTKKQTVLFSLLVLFFNLGTFKKSTETTLGRDYLSCRFDEKRIKDVNSVINTLLNVSSSKRLLVSGGLAPTFAQYFDFVFSINSKNLKKMEEFDFVIFEKGGGDSYPLTGEKISKLFSNTSNLVDSKYIHFSKLKDESEKIE